MAQAWVGWFWFESNALIFKMLRFDFCWFLSVGVNASFTPDLLPVSGRMDHALVAAALEQL